MTTADFRIDIFTRVDEVSSDWPEADAQTALFFVFQSKTYLKVWEKTYAPACKAQLCLVEVRDAAGAPVLFLPLCILRRRGARVLAFVDEGVCDYNAPILFPAGEKLEAEAAERLIGTIFARLPAFDLVHLAKMPEMVEDRGNPLWAVGKRPFAFSCHQITLDRSIEDIETSIKGARHFRKRMRALKARPGYSFVVARTPEERSAILAASFEQKQRRFVETKVPGFDSQPEKKAFFTLATEALAAHDALHLSAIVVEGQIIATMWSVIRKRYYCGLIPTFQAEAWSKYSPGKVILLNLIRVLKEDGYDCLDLGVGDEPYKRELVNRVVPLREYRAAHSRRGKFRLLREGILDWVRATAVYQKLRPLKWTLLRKLSR